MSVTSVMNFLHGVQLVWIAMANMMDEWLMYVLPIFSSATSNIDYCECMIVSKMPRSFRTRGERVTLSLRRRRARDGIKVFVFALRRYALRIRFCVCFARLRRRRRWRVYRRARKVGSRAEKVIFGSGTRKA